MSIKQNLSNLLESLTELTFLDEVRYSKKCYHCDSPEIDDHGDTIVCRECGCIHDNDSYQYTISSALIEVKGEGVAGWIPKEGNKAMPNI